MAGMLKRVAPLSYEAWIDYDVLGRRFTGADRRALARLLDASPESVATREGAPPLGVDDLKALGMSPREIRELAEKLTPGERPDFDLDLSRIRRARGRRGGDGGGRPRRVELSVLTGRAVRKRAGRWGWLP